MHNSDSEDWDDDFKFVEDDGDGPSPLSASASHNDSHNSKPNVHTPFALPPPPAPSSHRTPRANKIAQRMRAGSGSTARQAWGDSSDEDDGELGFGADEDRTVTARSRTPSSATPPRRRPCRRFRRQSDAAGSAPFPRSPTASVFSAPDSASIAYMHTSAGSTTALTRPHPHAARGLAGLPPSPPLHRARERRRLRKKGRPGGAAGGAAVEMREMRRRSVERSSPPVSTLSTIPSPSTPVHGTKAQASTVVSASVTAAGSNSAATVAVAIVSSLVGLAITGLIVALFLRRWSRKRKDRQRESMNFDPSTFRRSAVTAMLQDPLPPRLHAHDFGAGASFRSGSVQSDYRDSAHTAVAAFHQYPYGMPASESAATYTQHYSSAAVPASAEYYNCGASHASAPPQNLEYAPPLRQVGIPVGYPPELHRQGAFPGAPVHPNQMPPHPPPAHYQHYTAEDNDDAYGGI
ncbi:hypothetical protein GGX14DRAFT_644523 [Mycena pura]|uniref:Uncharacterized protein n=1 Tax=Mycena pura TaxID=153505 RepID=A0AAD6V861_9AGAR|nr:hypothetical protein GGX14DRAFT_644523 [Mycena pura]